MAKLINTELVNTSWEHPVMHVSGVQIWWFLPKSVTIYRADKPNRPELQVKMAKKKLEGQGQWPLFSIPAQSITGCMFGANLVIPAQICDELSCGQGKFHGRTDGQTDRCRQRQYHNIHSGWKGWQSRSHKTWQIQFLPAFQHNLILVTIYTV